ncbi:GxxExxY protein [Pendulispora brunnea]|uniref:GxxExxY protein n=1 Tax=Pendulispora brunnea TaxID=2905690 RepID=A0ABZ2KN76_9BACT
MNRQDARVARIANGIPREPGVEIDCLAGGVIEAALEVHANLGPGFSEGVYERALGMELTLRGIPFVSQAPLAVSYKGNLVGEVRLDMLVADCLVVELKAVEALNSLHVAQAVSYLKATALPLALLINFNTRLLLRGVRRVVLTNH